MAGVVEGDVAAAGVVADHGEFDGVETTAGAIGQVEILVGGGERRQEPGGAAEKVKGVVAGWRGNVTDWTSVAARKSERVRRGP